MSDQFLVCCECEPKCMCVRPPAGVVVISIIDDDGSAPALLIAITIS